MTAASPPDRRAWQAAIDRHFAGRGDAATFALISSAIEQDPLARRYFERAQLLAELDPSSTTQKDRLAAALGFAPEAKKKPALGFGWLPVAGIAAAAAAVLLVVVPGEPPPDDGFRSRGSGRVDAALRTSVSVYRIVEGTPPVEVEGTIRAGDELAFAYTNPDRRPYLMVWGVDDEGAVYWYHPAWTDPDASPRAVPVAGGPEVHELKEAIAHELGGERLTLFALFTDEQPSVHDVEAALAAKKPVPSTEAAKPGERRRGELLELGTVRVIGSASPPSPRGGE